LRASELEEENMRNRVFVPRFVLLIAVFVTVFASCEIWASVKPASQSAQPKVSDKYGYIDKRGRWAIKPQFDVACNFSSDGLAVVCKGESWYFIDKNGRPAIIPQTTHPIRELDGFSEGLAAVWLADGKCGYIDRTGKFVIKPDFDSAGSFINGLALVSKNDLMGFIDKTGNAIVPLRYKEAASFSEGLASVGIEKGNRILRGYIRPDGSSAVDFRYSSAESFSEGLAAVSLPYPSVNRGYIDKAGKLCIPPKFDEVGAFHKGLAWVCVNKTMGEASTAGYNWGLIDKSGKFVVKPQFYEVGDWSEGMASVSKGRWVMMRTPEGVPVTDAKDVKTGFIDEKGHVVVAPQFLTVGRFSQGLASVAVRVGKSVRCGFIDKTGRMVIKPRFECLSDELFLGLYTEVFSEGLCSVIIGGEIGYIDKSGKVVVKPQFGEAAPFSQGLASVSYVDHSDLAVDDCQ
jgi:hypothetical protein